MFCFVKQRNDDCDGASKGNCARSLSFTIVSHRLNKEAGRPFCTEAGFQTSLVIGAQAGFGHAWSERSKMLCRFLLGVLQRHASQAQRAEDGLKYVVAAGNVEQLP